MLALFNDFHNGVLPIERLNYCVITLLPKTDNAMEMKKIRPIRLLNVCYKIIAEVLNNRLTSCIHKVLSDCQIGFIKGRFILESVITLHEIIHKVKRKKSKVGLCLKLILKSL
jgi:hypothetical protein